MHALTDAMYVVSNALLAPVLVALLVMLAWMFCLLGGFVREALERRHVRARLNDGIAVAKAGAGASAPDAIWNSLTGVQAGTPARFCRYVSSGTTDSGLLDRGLTELENDISASIASLSFVTRVGPMLGLMGTLIPLGPALSGLAAGNVQVLSSNLVVAFTATVVGLVISGGAYGMGLARRTWYARDLNDLEFMCQRLSSGASARSN